MTLTQAHAIRMVMMAVIMIITPMGVMGMMVMMAMKLMTFTLTITIQMTPAETMCIPTTPLATTTQMDVLTTRPL